MFNVFGTNYEHLKKADNGKINEILEIIKNLPDATKTGEHLKKYISSLEHIHQYGNDEHYLDLLKKQAIILNSELDKYRKGIAIITEDTKKMESYQNILSNYYILTAWVSYPKEGEHIITHVKAGDEFIIGKTQVGEKSSDASILEADWLSRKHLKCKIENDELIIKLIGQNAGEVYEGDENRGGLDKNTIIKVGLKKKIRVTMNNWKTKMNEISFKFEKAILH